jgi:hypothetical protein
LVGAGSNGIYSVDIPGLSNTSVTGSASGQYGYSQLEMAYNGKIYAGSSTDIRAIDLSFTPLTISPFSSPNNLTIVAPNSNYPGTSPPFYTLPDQIDGQNYDGITVGATYASVSSYIATSSASWSYISNPWSSPGAVEITGELRIPSGGTGPANNVTITGMRFEFGPTAKIVIEQNASLTLDGTTLTASHCGGMWKGIELWGNKTHSQFPPGQQGKLIIKNISIR